MSRKSDIINSFIQAKNNRKKLTASKQQEVNRLLGSQVLKTNQIIKVSKFKMIKEDNLSHRTINHGFQKALKEIQADLSAPEKRASQIIHHRAFEIGSFVINSIILNPSVTAKAMISLFVLNLSYYSLCAFLSYYYNHTVLIWIIIASFVISAIAHCISLLKSSK